MTKYNNISSPIGNKLHCKGWQQEAAFRMLQNNLDNNVAESPQDLIVYGGYGKAARNWDCYEQILDSLINGKPLKPGSFRGRKNTAPENKKIINGEKHA